MRVRFKSIFQILVGIVLVVGLCAEVGVAQKRKRRTTKRTAKPVAPRPVITNPAIAPPATDGEIRIISTAEEGAVAEPGSETPARKETKPAAPGQSSDDVQRTITTLSNQVNKLNEKLTQIQEEERDEREMERLTRAEQRAEQLRTQLLDVQTKLADLESKLELVEYSLRPENIEKAAVGMGTVRPEEVRETRKKQLENEKARIQAQLKLLESSKSRLELSLNTADAEVDQLRTKIELRRLQPQTTEASKPTKPDDPPLQ